MTDIISKGFTRVIIYVYYTARPKYINPIFYMRIINEWLKRRKLMEQEELWSKLSLVLKKSSSTGCEFSDFYYLHRFIKTTDGLKNVLELGTGISTLIFAQACKELKEQGKAYPRIITMEESLQYQQNCLSWFPEDLKDYVEFHQSDRVQEKEGEVAICYYNEIPELPYDFIFIDGPTLSFAGVKSINYDLVNIYNINKSRSIVAWLDQRVGTYWEYKRIFKKASIKYNVIKKLTEINF